jgi:hypothetical protein
MCDNQLPPAAASPKSPIRREIVAPLSAASSFRHAVKSDEEMKSISNKGTMQYYEKQNAFIAALLRMELPEQVAEDTSDENSRQVRCIPVALTLLLLWFSFFLLFECTGTIGNQSFLLFQFGSCLFETHGGMLLFFSFLFQIIAKKFLQDSCHC